jgi:hypothetical protein
MLYLAVNSALQLLQDQWSGYLKSTFSMPIVPTRKYF